MKKIICFLLSILVLWGCSSTDTASKIQIQGIENINYEKLTQNLNSNVKFILYIGRPDCGDCQEFYPILEEYIENHEGSGIYYLNIKDFRDRAKAESATKEEKDFYDNLSNGKFIKTYQYLDEDYIEIKDREKQKAKRQEFLDQFQVFMDDYFKEDL